EAFRAVDRRVALIIAAAVGLGGALQATGAALYIAQALLGALEGASPRLVLSALFILIAVFANVINAKACAVLFTPIAVAAATRLNLDPLPFVVTVIFASNCCYATPIGHQANLLVMAPGRYRFVDYLAAGTPLVLIVWVAFMLIVPWYYGLN
ncbi:MAG TPA: SLC13 family permease, partial [Alphaproteobacteria bacterium]|nr:SLC13 family permease [Alphaproteobacteria bacterium]